MCNFKSGLIFKNRVVLAPENNESHSTLLENLNIEDSRENAMRMFVRAELVPPSDDKMKSVDEWKFRVDQDIVPDWYDEDTKRYEDEFRNAVKKYMEEYKKDMVEIDGYYWRRIKRDGNRIYYLMENIFMKFEFGKDNNYATSYIRKKLNDSYLAKNLKEAFGDKLVPIRTDLLSLDGLDDYGVVEGDVLAIPTLDLYRECRKKISKLDKWWWLATPDSTPSGYGSNNVLYVGSVGGVNCGWFSNCGSVRPFFILEVDDENKTK